MTRILVAEDSRTQAVHIQYCLEHAGYEVELAVDGRKALDAIARRPPDLVVTDLQMPEMDGTQLVVAVGQSHPALPVVLLTHEGSEDLALVALQRGAAGFVAKSQLQHGVARALCYVLRLADDAERQTPSSPSLDHAEFSFTLDNDLTMIAPLALQCQTELMRLGAFNRPAARQFALALAEAVDNAIWHGNLELDSAPRAAADPFCQQLVAERRALREFRDRRVHVDAAISPSQAVCTVRDEGSGFDLAELDQLADPSQLVESHGRGLILMRHLIDQLEHNAKRNEITLIKRSPSAT